MDLNRWKIFQGLDPLLTSKCKIAKFVRCDSDDVKAGFLVLQNDDVYAVADKSSVGATGSEVSKVESLCGKGIIDFFGNALGFVALSKSGCVYSWGHQDRDSDGDVSMPRQLLFNGDVSAHKVCEISSGFVHNLCLTSDGQVFGWGIGEHLGSSSSPGAQFEIDPMKITGVGDNTVQVAAGLNSSYTLDSVGRVWSWGTSESSALGHDDTRCSTRTRTPRVIENLYNIKKIAAGCSHALALSEIGELYFWGDFGYRSFTKLTPTKVTIESTEPVTDIGSTTPGQEVGSCNYAVFQTKDTVYVWGCWHGRYISEPMATELTSIDEAFANADLPTMLRPITMPVQSHGVEIAWKRAFDDQFTLDIVFSVENEKLHAHANFLKLRSEYFRNMLDGDWGEYQKSARPIEIQGFSFRVFKAFIYFLYHESLMDSDAMTVEDLTEVMRAADFYGNEDLRSACENKLKSLLTLENSCFIYACAVQSNAQNLQDDASDFMAPVFTEVAKSPEFANMDNDCKAKLLIHFADLIASQARKKRRLQ